MPARVVVVKRARRRSFALLWAAIAWLRSVLAALFGPARPSAGDAGDAPAPDATPGAASGSAAEPFALPRVPVLLFSETGETLCTACNVCVEICPSRALELDATTSAAAPAATSGLRLFVLRLGACIGCGACAEACPEAALGLVPAPAVAIANGLGRPEPIDLLAGAGVPR